MNFTAKFFTLALIALLQPTLTMAAGFNANDIVVVSIGDGTPTLGNGITVPVSLLSFSPTGVPGDTITMPTVSSGPVHALTLSNNRQAGGLNLTTDGRYLVLGGTDNAPRPAANSSDVRTIGRIDAAGNVDTSTTVSDAYTGTTNIGIRSVASFDGSSYYTTGNGGTSTEVRYQGHGETNGTVSLSASSDTSRHVAIAGGNLFFTKDESLNQIGSGLPTTGTQSVTALSGVGGPPSGGNWNSPVFFDLNPLVAGLDTLYLGSQRSTNAEIPAIVKYTFDGTTWTQAYTLDVPSIGPTGYVGMLFLTGRVEGSDVVLYGVTDTSGAPSFNNSLVKLTDTGPGSTFTTLANSGTAFGFRGVAFAPVPEPSSIILVAGVAALGLTLRKRIQSRKI